MTHAFEFVITLVPPLIRPPFEDGKYCLIRGVAPHERYIECNCIWFVEKKNHKYYTRLEDFYDYIYVIVFGLLSEMVAL